MASIIKGQIIKHLSKFAKNLSQDKIRLSTLKGEANLVNLELDEEALMEVLEFPSWLVLNRVVCNKVSVKIPWTKLKTHPISIYLDQVELDMATCRTLRETKGFHDDLTNKQVPASRYGFPEKVVDGMHIHINSITGILKSDTFHINLQIAQLIVQSTTPNWKLADLRYTRIKDASREQILTFKEVEWSTVRLTLDAIENDTDRPTTPIRLITNQGKVRITIKKREVDCILLTSKLQMLLDDILWVLTDSQMKAVISHVRSLMPVVRDAANQSKARAADKGQPTAPAQTHEDPSGHSHSIKTHKELQNLKYFERYDVQETSYHLFTRRIDLHLCDEMNQPDNGMEETFRRRIANGAMQIGLHGLSLDYYPFHTASSSREHWEFYDEPMKTSDKWIHTLLAHLKQQYKHAADHIAKETARVKGQAEVKAQVKSQGVNKDNTTNPPPRPQTPPKSTPKPPSQPPDAKPHPKPQHQPSQPIRTGQRGQAARSRVKLMSHSMVVRLRDFQVHCVALGKAASQNAKTPLKQFMLAHSDKKTFFLPSDMSSVHVEYTSFYFPDELTFPVPSPIAYIQVNPIQLRLDYTSVLWLNQFSCNILQSLSNMEGYSQGLVPGGKDHTNIRIDALMPKFILPAEVPVDGQPDRPPELHVQLSQLTATNCRVGTASIRPDLSSCLQALHTHRLFTGSTAFPGDAGDRVLLPKLFWEHAYQPNYSLPSACDGASTAVANGSVANSEQRPPSGVGRLTTYVFRPDAVDDVWNVKIDQIWADFHDVPSSPDRPVPLVDPIPLSLWGCYPRRPVQASHRSPAQLEATPRSQARRSGESVDVAKPCANCNEEPTPTLTVHDPLSNGRSPTTEGSVRASSGQHLVPPEQSDRQTDSNLLAQTPTKIHVIINHYQMLFLLRLQQSLQQLLESVETDRLMFAPKDHPEPILSRTVAFQAPDIELTLVMPPITEEDSEERTSPEIDAEVASSPELTLDENVATPDVPTVEISDSSPVKEFRAESFGSVSPSVDTSSKGFSSSLENTPSFPSPQRRNSQESAPTTYHPAIRGGATDPGQPPRSASQSDLARIHHAQFSFSSLKQAESMTSLDESVDLDLISLSSDSSEGFVMAIRADGLSIGSGSGQGTETETDSEIVCEVSNRTLVAEQIVTTPEEDYSRNKFKLNKVSVVTFHLSGINAAVEVTGSDVVVKVQVDHVTHAEKGNTDYTAFISSIAAGERSKKSEERKESSQSQSSPILLLRFQSGPKAEILSPGGGKLGFLQLEVSGLVSAFRTSTITHLGSFLIDEIISEAVPMSIRVLTSKIELLDDAPPIFPTHPGPVPMPLTVSSILVRRTIDGVFHIEGLPDSSNVLGVPSVLEDKTPMVSPAQLEEENMQLISQVLDMKKALDVLENERSSLLGTLEHLQEELLTVDRERDMLRNRVVDLSRQVNLPR